ncbi:hypothetical protein Poli38472_012616 [Pythium oligandrum]|uniref:START-like domain n=1 Tax=Pythium oligandrum TaxID=41045 RepID=A0A8K1FFA1_PYTOL|nr:hypothetical protein Poli38472_012616 [Pythium oligandrum]|eukprot:TMW61425.1 hypothetical protein Poli38472_012616 [Pythium oligandrum]
MKLRLPAHALPELTLTPDEKHWIVDEAQGVIDEALRAERKFALNGRHVNKAEWKLVKSKDDFHVYRERSGGRRRASTSAMSLASTSSSCSSSGHQNMSLVTSGRSLNFSVNSMSSEEHEMLTSSRTSRRMTSTLSAPGDGGIVSSMKESHVPMLLGAGYVRGTIEDSVFGAQSGDDVAWRLRASYMKDKFADARILATVRGPTHEDPFQYLGVKWFTKEQPKLMGSFIQRRDFLIIEATGYKRDAYGIPYGYYLLHSVKLKDVPPLTELDVIRCNVSMCFISRQVEPNNMHIFARGFSDPRGEMLASVGVALTAESILAVSEVGECAFVKKLTWFLRKKQHERHQQLLRTHAFSNCLVTKCESCNGSLMKLLGGMRSGTTSCEACAITICSKCTVSKKLILEVNGDGVVDRELPFCYICVLEAKNLSARDVALDGVPVPARPSMRRTMSCASRPTQHIRRHTETHRKPSVNIVLY